MKPLVGQIHDRVEELEWHVLADHGGGLEETLVVVIEPVDTGGQDVADGPRQPRARRRLSQSILSTLAKQDARVSEHQHRFFEKERIPLRSLQQQAPQVLKTDIGADEGIHQAVGALADERIEAELSIERASSPG